MVFIQVVLFVGFGLVIVYLLMIKDKLDRISRTLFDIEKLKNGTKNWGWDEDDSHSEPEGRGR